MEYIGVLNPSIKAVLFLRDMVIEKKRVKNSIRDALDSLNFDMEGMKQESILKEDDQAMQELSYDVENFVHEVAPDAYIFIKTTLGTSLGPAHLSRIESFRSRIKDIRERLKSKPNREVGGRTSLPSGSEEHPDLEQLVGILKPKEELRKLLLSPAPADGEPHRLRVISIVGCSGLGKSALAWALYNDGKVTDEFGKNKVWVVASECNKAEDLLEKILQGIRQEPAVGNHAATSDVKKLRYELHEFLRDTSKRYLVVLDNMVNEEAWHEIQKAFPEEDKAGNRIIVTTSVQKIATSRSRGRHQHKMQGLNQEDSQKLFWREVGCTPTTTMVANSASIFSKCDGSPFALLSVAAHLRKNDPSVSVESCKDVGRALGTDLAGAVAGNPLWNLKSALVQCYNSLPDSYHIRMCLLSISMFFKGRRINRKSLVRRWVAEELVVGEAQRTAWGVALKHFTDFVNRGIIEPVLVSDSYKGKRCQVKGAFLEFIVHRSISTANFVTLIDNDDHLPVTRDGNYPVRRLCVHGGTQGSTDFAKYAETELSVLRWLTICDSAPFDFSKCKLLRVLDLEGGKGISARVMSNICKLVFLKYISLRRSDITQIPEQITELVNLETLDIRETEVKALPMEVVMMPGLVRLFGKFKLVPRKNNSLWVNRGIFNQKKGKICLESKLETLSGVDIQMEDQCFEEIMLHAKKLKKVKIWCKCNTTSATDLIPIERFNGRQFLESLSVDSSSTDHPIGFLSDDFLSRVKGACMIRSLKLRGALGALTQTRINQLGLEELQLTKTGLTSEALSVLQKISCLLYLKLADDRHEFGNGSFIVEEDGFSGLRRLCVEAPRLPKVRVKKGGMPLLVTLELLITSPRLEAPLQTGATSDIASTQLEAPLQTAAASEATTPQTEAPLQAQMTAEIERRLGVEGVSHLAELHEVILDHSADDKTMLDWEEIAVRHINRPHLKKKPE